MEEQLNENEDVGQGSKVGGFHWMGLFVVGFLLMGFLSLTLWHRVMQVDPVQRCADAYESSYTKVDTTLVDRMSVRSPTGGPHTTCGVLRLNGSVDKLPRRELRNKTMP
jgi:hypothetical protein